MPGLPRADITGLVLAGGRGSRMGGVDKGLQLLAGRPLAQHALERLRAQVGPLLVSANRNAESYAALGAPVVADSLPDQPGPLAGMLAALQRCRTPYLAVVPCDAPDFPADLVARLAGALALHDAEIAMAATLAPGGGVQFQPVFCLLQATLRDSLAAYLAGGQRRVDRWTAQHRCVQVLFDDAQAFVNANTALELQRLPLPPGRPA
jgi:molybdopterin-guanine dinucleotide biosynthesis protein A